MAKKSRMQDPADAALSAIEEALNLGASGTERTDGERAQLPNVDDGFSFDREPTAPSQPPLPQPPPSRAGNERASAMGARRLPAMTTRPA